MPSNYPSALDTYGDPSGGAVQGSTTPTHSGHHTNHNDAIEAIEAKLGTGGAAPPASAAVLRRTGTGASGWGQVAAGDYAAGSLVNADVSASAAITAAKLAAGGTANRVVATSDGSTMAMQQVATAMIAANAVTQAAGVTGTTNNPATASGTPVLLPEMTVSVTFTGGPALILFSGILQHSVPGTTVVVDLQIASTFVERRQFVSVGTNAGMVVAFSTLTTPLAGVKTVEIMWWVSGAVASAIALGTQRSLAVVELKR